ncbi:MAG: HNH endonuclease [Clostridia bacterium]|nr:HNH endonuclease [Clostridia bacterium]
MSRFVFLGERVRYEKERDPFYGTSRWLAARQRALDRDLGRCVWCKQAGRYTIDRRGRRLPVLATMVHHIKPRKEYPELELDLDNLVSLCDKCHDDAHPEKFGKQKKEKPPTPAQVMGIQFEQL